MRFMNLLTVGLLTAILIGVLFTPRFNYKTIALTQADLKSQHERLQARLGRIELFAGLEDDSSRLAAVVQTLGSVPDLIEAMKAEFTALQVWTSNVAPRIEDLSRRIEVLEAQYLAAVPGGSEFVSPLPQFEPVELGSKLREISGHFSPRATAEWRFEEFLSHAVDAGLLPSADSLSLSPETYESLLRRFSRYQLDIDLINYAQDLLVRQLVEDATENGDYVDVPAVTDDTESLRINTRATDAVVHVKNLPDGHRIYRFPMELHTEFAEYNNQRDGARDHLILDVGSLVDTAVVSEGK